MSDLEILLAEGQRISPDPVDMFEDRLASSLGLERGPGLSDAAWRQRRVAFIDAFPDEEVALIVANVEAAIGGWRCEGPEVRG